MDAVLKMLLGHVVRSTLHKNGSKHPMLQISMADNVISYTKIKRNTKKNADKSRVIMLQSTLGN